MASGIFIKTVTVLALLTAGTVGTADAALQFPAHRSRAMDVQFAGGAYADTAFEDVPYVSAEFLADLFGQSTTWDPQAQQLRVQGAGKREWVFTLDNPFASVQGQVYNLTYPVRRGPERVYLPLHTLLRLLSARFDIDIRPAGMAAPEKSAAATPVVPTADPAAALDADLIAGMTLEESGGGSVLRIRSGAAIRWQGIRTGSHYLLRAFDGRLAPGFPRKLRGGATAQIGRASV